MFLPIKSSNEKEISVLVPTKGVSTFTSQSEAIPLSESSKEKTNSALSKDTTLKDSNSISSKDLSK